MNYNDAYAELCSFKNIPLTPAWYYDRFPGFYNVECYRILANWTGGVRSEEQIKEEEEEVMKFSADGVEEEKENHDKNKKRKYEAEISEEQENIQDGLCSEF
jgi:hypothetical protein